ncbi:hypothetical protein HF638_04430 [Paenibacillus sp. SZ31]|uniref:hypothetical protein n=1 Tax=Paenibacillus sp. SZ31 TaxID=2725555 RepID=UPI00146B3EAB|nr:hypothetical protein [Paenibacillus sp. SZ31]NMI03207.1 hypothetical protein [Paenibacillus sp. SZ31]
MNCPKCNKNLSLNLDFPTEETCPHCDFYYYIGNLLKIMFIANLKVNQNQETYFSNVHQRIYNPFIASYKGEVKKGAEIVVDRYIEDFKALVSGYAKEDLYFMALALREIATWNIFSDDVWDSSRLRNLSHVFITLLELTEEKYFGDYMINQEEDFINVLVICEELFTISDNIKLNDYFSWNVGLEEMLKTKIENDRLEWFHNMFEFKELIKPEEIEFEENAKLKLYLKKRNLETEKLNEDVGKEIEMLYGFNFEDLDTFRNEIIGISTNHEQIHNISPTINGYSMKCSFIFESQFTEMSLSIKKIHQIISYFKYESKGDSKYRLSNPHMDYKFIFKYENFIAIGFFDSANSITVFKNLAMSDHFVEEMFGSRATLPFKKAQEKISTLIAYKIALHFQNKYDYYVPIIEKDIPYVNIKMFQGNGIRKKIVNSSNQDLGDLDAVVINKVKKEVIIFEIKYYKPASELTEILKKDKKIFDDIDKIQRRAAWVRENMDDVITAWNLQENEYTVKTYLVTARPNYFGKQIETENADISYFTLDGILNS